MRVLQLSKEKMYISVSYDITSTRYRNKVVKVLESYGFRVQKSVFEIQCNNSQYKILKKKLKKILNLAEKDYSKGHENRDSIRFYILSKIGEGTLNGRLDGIGKAYEKVYFEDCLII